MATWVVGDIQGCADEFDDLLAILDLGSDDALWLAGDLVNRGPDSLGVMRRVLSIQCELKCVLGNHDLHFLAAFFGNTSKLHKADTLLELLEDADVAGYAEWLCQQHLLVHSQSLDWAMCHAGIPHIWTLQQALEYAEEVMMAWRDEHPSVSREQYFQGMYGNKPDVWDSQLSGLDRLRLITSYLTRMRLINQSGRLDFAHKLAPVDLPEGYLPWYQHPLQLGNTKLAFGHWASLDGNTGVHGIYATDTGCVYGRKLSALCLESQKTVSVPARNPVR